MTAETYLSELLAAKFSHDIAGPVSAVANGVELLSENDDADMQAQAAELLKMSADELRMRVQVFRQAYGVVNGSGNTDMSELEATFKDYFKYLKTGFDVVPGSLSSFSLDYRRLVVNLVLLAFSCLIGKGSLKLELKASGGDVKLTVKGEALKTKIDPELETVLAGTVDKSALSVKTIQPYFTWIFAQKFGATIAHAKTDNTVAFTVTGPESAVRG